MRFKNLTIGLAVVALTAGAARATVRYVDVDSPNDGPGNDWAHAFHSVQAGLNAAASGGQGYVPQLLLRRTLT